MTSPDTRWYVAMGGQSHGPYAVEDIGGFLKEGKITPKTKVCPVGGNTWSRLSGALPDLVKEMCGTPEMQLEDSPPPPPPPPPDEDDEEEQEEEEEEEGEEEQQDDAEDEGETEEEDEDSPEREDDQIPKIDIVPPPPPPSTAMTSKASTSADKTTVSRCPACRNTLRPEDLVCGRCGLQVREDLSGESSDEDEVDSIRPSRKPNAPRNKEIAPEKTKAGVMEKLVKLIVLITLAWDVIAILTNYQTSDGKRIGDNIVGIALVNVFVFLLWISGFGSHCPKCRRYWARRSLGVMELGRDEGYKTVTREDRIYDSKGSFTGTRKREEQVRVTKIENRNFWKCKRCGYEWSVDSVQTRES